jgi:hypothetical protein
MYFGITKVNRKKVIFSLGFYLIFIAATISIIIPRVELYSQNAAIAFYKACAKQDCYVETHGFKSYAYLFYSNRKPAHFSNPTQIDFINKFIDERVDGTKVRYAFYSNAYCHWMKYEKIDKPAYIICKKSHESEMYEIREFTKLYERNGYCFFVRMP